VRHSRVIRAGPKRESPAPGKEGPTPEEILLKYWPQISYRVKNSIGRSTPDWEDVGSEILLGVVQAIRKGTFRGECALQTFIYSITTHKIIDYIRQKRKIPEQISEPGQDHDPSIHVEQQRRVKLVADLLKRLPPRYADILYLHYYLDLSRKKIAQVYGISPGRVGVLMATARNTLRDLMKKLGVEDSEKRFL
jgi:RNA polymerase sigma-70 factor (ECF subfamily)